MSQFRLPFGKFPKKSLHFKQNQVNRLNECFFTKGSMDMPLEVSVAFAAKYLGTTERTILNYLKSKQLQGQKVGKLWFIKTDSLFKMRPQGARLHQAVLPSIENPKSINQENRKDHYSVRSCEVVGASKKRVPYNYAQPLTRMESCFDESGVFNSKLTGCYLDWPAATHGRISGNSLIFKKRSAKVILNLLNTFKASKTPFPVAGGKGGFEEDKKTIPWPSGDRWIEFWSNDIQLLLFGKVLFPTYLTSQRNLFHITLNIAFANNPDSHGHILISKNMLEAAQINTSPEMYRLYIQFLVSHEIAHYVYEWYLHTHASKLMPLT